jgi:plastocyanin
VAVLVVCGLGAAAVGAAVAFGALSRSAVSPVTVTVGGGTTSPVALHGVVGPGFTISFTYADGSNVTSLNPGTYKIQVDDLSNIHNFHLYGTGVDTSTGVDPVGVSQWTATLQPGFYTFICDPHATTMVGQLRVLPYGTMTYFPAPAAAPVASKKHKLKH